MSFRTGVHSFQGGMIKDLDKSLITKERYLEARNFRLTTSSGESTGALENIEGNNNIANTIGPSTPIVVGNVYVVVKGTATYRTVGYTLGQYFTAITDTTGFTGSGALVINANEIVPAGMYVCGNTLLRDWIILFLTNNTMASPTTGRSMIVKMKVSSLTEKVTDYSILYDDTANNTIYRLRFSTANPIKAIGMYESATIQKVYWTDGYNNVRYANISSYLTTDGLVKSGGNYYFPVDLFEFIPESSMTKPILDRLSPGAITAGMVQYAFQYYNDHGSETMMSPLSNIIHITSDDDYVAGSYYYSGEGDITKTTGKSVRMTFTLTNSNKYSHIRIVRLYYQTVNAVPTITIVGEVPINSTMSTASYLDTGNTTYGTLTLDEFNLGQTELFTAEDIAVKNSRLFAGNINKEEFTLGAWDSRAVRFLLGGSAVVTDSEQGNVTILPNLSNWADYTADHDGINLNNDPAYDANASYHYRYQADGATLGAEGPNIKIGFTTDTITLDAASSGQLYNAALESTSDNKSFTSFASPYMTGRRSWQRDETYRLYIVFFNAHGISSSAKWICDLRMPSIHESGYSTLGIVDGSNINTTALYPTVQISSWPTGAVSAQLLRMERGGDDRSVLTQAAVVPTRISGGVCRPKTMNTVINDTTGGFVVKLVSPEINILKNISRGSSDYLEYITRFGSPQLTEEGTWVDYYRYRTNTRIPFAANTKSIIDDTLYVTPRLDTDTFSFNNQTTSNFNTDVYSTGCSGLLVHHQNNNWTADGNDYVVVNYKRDVHASQYGGQTFESREGNAAVPASDIITTLSTPYTAWNGDTFINFFEVNTHLSWLERTTTNSLMEVVMVPLESSINCDLRHGYLTSRHVMEANHDLVQETAGEWTNASGAIYHQTESMYQYNTVYSQNSNAKYYINIPSSVSVDTEFDCMIRVSKNKINGESQDSFTLFPINDFIEVSTDKGAITTLNVINDKLLFWQENAFGILSVNERSLIQDSSGAALVLGTGGLLDRYDYISESIGSTNKQHVISTQTGVYWLYTKDRSIYRFTSNLQSVSKSKLIQSWLDEQLTPTQLGYNIVRAVYDVKYNHVLFSFYNTNSALGETLVYDETIDAFSGFYDFSTYNFILHPYGFLTTAHLHSADLLFYHNSLLKERCCFYSTIPSSVVAESTAPVPKFVNSTVKIVFNDEYGHTKVFDNLSFVSTASVSDVEVYNNTFSSIRCYNNYQNTDYCNLVYGTNLERDEREWTTFVPRNAVDTAYTSNPDIFNASNIDKTRTFRERIRDKYMVTDFTYTNTSNRRFVVPYVTVKYRISPR